MTPFMPRTTENVYTMQVTIKIPMVIHLELSTWSRLAAVWLISGVARLKVVAVPANRAKTAKRSMRRPGALSVREPRIGRQASEYFCFLHFLTWSIKPKAQASTT